MSLHSQRRSNRYPRPPRRRGFLSTLARVFVAAGLSSGALVGVVVATQGSAGASGFGSDAFMNIDGSIRYASSPASPANQFGWANSGAATPASTCTGSQVGVSGTNGLYDCGAPNPTVTNGVPLAPKYIGPSSVLAQEFLTTPDNNVVPGCLSGAAGTYDFPGSQVFNEGLTQMSYSFVKNVPQKDAVSDAYVVSRINSAHDVEVYFGAQRTDNSGDSHVDFQFLQDSVTASGTCSGGFSGNREQGDMLVEVNYQIGGSSAVPNVYMWVCNTTSPTGTKCDTTGDWVQQTVPSTPVLAAIEASNSAPIPCGGWVCLNTVTTPSGPAVDTNEFVEGAINLGKFGFGVGCGSSVLVETRTSGQSGTSQLASLAKPTGFATCAETNTTTTPSSKTIQLGQSLTDSVTVGGNASLGTPTGKVTFYVCSNTTTGCTSTANPITPTAGSPNPVTLDSSGKATSPSYTPAAPGNYCFSGVYTPTPGNFYKASSDTSADECFTVTALTPTFTTSPTSSAITLGGTNTDKATVAGVPAGGVPGGSVQFYLCQVPSGSTTCTGGDPVGSPVGLQTDPSAADTATATSPPGTPTGAGTWCFNASYTATTGGNYSSVDAETNGAHECFTVNKEDSVTTTTASVGTGGGLSDTVFVSPKNSGPPPSGTVQFYICNTTSTFCPTSGTPDGSPVKLTPPPSGSTSTATATFTPTAAGTWCFSAVYSGDSNYNASEHNTTAGNSSTSECIVVGKIGTQTSTTVIDAATNQAWSGTEVVGASAYDTGTVVPNSTFNNTPPTGTFSYVFFQGNGCSGAQVSAGSSSLTGQSSTEGPLAAGSYSFQATYSGDSNYSGSTGPCENFSVNKGTVAVDTTVFDAATNAAWSGSETTGASAYDTSTVTGSSTHFAPSGGTVSYTFFPNDSCTAGTGSSAGSGLALDAHSTTEGPLGAGSYSFEASYSGDSNYNGNTGQCEPLTVNKGTVTVDTTVFDAATNQAWSGSETTGASAYDTSTVTGSSSDIAPSGGTVSYTFFPNDSCTVDTGSSAGSGLALDAHSTTEGPLGAGSYSFEASYSGDSNYKGNTGQCEPFNVGQGTSSVDTVVFDAATNSAWTGAETGTPSAYDTSTVTASSKAIAPTGTISYLFFTNGTCAADTGTDAGTDLALGSHSTTEGPLAQGVYSFQATYSGDANYAGSPGACEPFSLGFPVITAHKTSSPTDGSVVHPGDTVTYTITLTNAGLTDATGVQLMDVVPAGTTYVPGSASDSGTLNGTTINWSGLTVPGGGTKAVSFQVTVNAKDIDGQKIPNHAVYPDINTPQTSCFQSSDTTPTLQTVSVASVQQPAPFCDTNTVTLTVAIPIINVAKSEPTPGNGQTVTAGQSAPITYQLSVTNTGSADATNVIVTDVIPTGATYVSGSATPAADASYNSSTKTITWTIPTVAAKSSLTPPLTFEVTVNAADANGSTITNQASFTNLNTPSCTAGPTTAVCLTNTVSNPVIVLQTAPAPQVATTTTTKAPHHVLAFTGLNAKTLAILAIGLVGGGMILVLIGRRRRPNQN